MKRRGREDRPIDRGSGPVAEFVDDLRRLRGRLSLREIGERMLYHSSTISRRLTPDELPPLDFVRSYVAACGGDVEAWERRWRGLAVPAESPSRPRRRARIAVAAIALAVIGAGTGVAALSGAFSSGADAEQAALPGLTPAPVASGRGFDWKVDRMTVRLSSREWVQSASGTIEVWANMTCPVEVTTYWMAVRPDTRAIRFTCNAWQYHKWEGIPAGRHHFEIWKTDDGLAIHGQGVLQANITIHERPKPTQPG
ncbi:hypothetical protein HII36_03610 [Nonomuraea sp. NN258]|uniref:hypothetical protein n=1 Tax=Nonomuraea antri TaxID=2730852 RepID=UPI001568613C|nr:hypothetical protein [Nonomuraea antri]NRQ30924.1 hypothetical protein [Nonomuraea antri]